MKNIKTKILILLFTIFLISGCVEKPVEELTKAVTTEEPSEIEEPKPEVKKEVGIKEETTTTETKKPVIKVTFPEMVLIPARTFDMGAERFFWEDGTEWPAEKIVHDDWMDEITTDERPIHQVSLDSFYLSKYETTNKEFKEFIDDTGYVTTAEKDGFCETLISEGMDFEEQKVEGLNWRHPIDIKEGISDKLDHPVACVSWVDAVNYLNWLSEKQGLEPAYFLDNGEIWKLNTDASGYRLPTETEWEYAAIGGHEKITYPWLGSKKFWIFPWGNPDENTKHGEHMNIYQQDPNPDKYEHTAPVGSFEATGYGLYDMAGNTAEWVNDWYSDEYYQYCVDNKITKNPLGPSEPEPPFQVPSGEIAGYKVHRGGSWATCQCWTRTTDRAGVNSHKTYNYIGFRIAKNSE